MNKHTSARPARTACTGAGEGADRSLLKPPTVGKQRAKSTQTEPMPATAASANLVQQIIVPTDFSPADIRLVHRAIMLGDIFEIRVTVLHVIDINDPRWANYSGSAADFMRQLKTDAEQHMRELLDGLAEEGIEVEPLTVEGLPGREILKVLQPASLLLTGRPTAKPFWRLFSKRTVQQVLQEARCTLMICPS